MYDVSNFQFLTAVSANPGEIWSAADYIQSNCVLVWSKVNILILAVHLYWKICCLFLFLICIKISDPK